VKEKFTENLDEGSDLSGERAFESHGAAQQTQKFRSGSDLKPRSRDLRRIATQFSLTQPVLESAQRAFFGTACRYLQTDDVNKTSPAVHHAQSKQGKIAAMASTGHAI
jgi:hypothetical protein